MRHKTLCLFILTFLMSGCTYLANRTMDTSQGNLLSTTQIHKVKVGMGRAQVAYLVGTPVLTNPFEVNSWEYVDAHQKSTTSTIKRRVVIHFKNHVVSRIERI